MRRETFDLTEHNARIFFSGDLADWYADQTLCAAETTILLRHKEAFAGKTVLDLGVGSGRTTRFLLPFAGSYTGVDLSPQMIARARRGFPKARLLEMDIRELAALSAAPTVVSVTTLAALVCAEMVLGGLLWAGRPMRVTA